MRFAALTITASAVLLLGACSSVDLSQPGASTRLMARSNSNVSGTVTFAPVGNGVRVMADVSGLRPNSEHGFHVHEKGDCSAPDATSAGGHFNPGSAAHGKPGDASHHAGDMPNLKADAAGNAKTSFVLPGLAFSGANGVVGRAVVIHRDPDDYQSQPAGNSGPRIACGVVQSARM